MVGSEQGGVTVTAMETAIQEEALQRYRPYPAYKDSGVDWLGEIPTHWEIARVGDLMKLVNGYPFDSEFFLRGEGVPLVRIRDLGSTETEVNYTGPVIDEAWIETGDIIIGMDGDFNVGRWRGPRALLNQRMCCLRARSSTDSGFASYLLPAPLKVINDLTYSTTVKHLSSNDVHKIRLGLPPEPEQRSIAAFLDRETARIDALVAKKQRLIELLQEQRTALITRAVTTGLDARSDAYIAGTEIFPLLPLGWKIRKLRRILTQKKRPVEVQQDSDYQEIGIRSWGRGIFHKEPLKGALLEEKSVYRIQPGDFVLNIVFAWEGAVAIASEQERGMIGSHRFPTFLVSEEVDPDYLLMVFQVGQGRWLMEVNSPGAAGRNKTIRLNQFLDELIPLPPLATQQALVRRVREEEQRLADLTQKLRIAIARLQELRTAVISAAVTGKIDVREEVV
ncbi:restriction endonuclease subunit S [Synechococcus sp. CBW1107]|uniref:restriction endonuclease subunit S n=1 Tax=Synechococcus sp. CBW1107 TaxID=2789857 RepID=UPI0018CD0693|nr:restriction endonuclease subunit S [Synechococcus sp. CBW1107]QPN57360.1 restriction endonuclease subunit S [Synechococcus sp. CBW1107]